MPAMKPRARADVTVVELDGEAVVYDEQNGSLHHLNPSATIVFSLCDGLTTVRELSAEIAGAFRVPEPDVRRDIYGLVRQLRTSGLLEEPARR